jgi:hypothetical protein
MRQPSLIAKSEFWQSFGVVSLLHTLGLVSLNSDRGSTFFCRQFYTADSSKMGPPERAEVDLGAGQSKETP